jgi:hypothetical protein
MPTSDTQAQRFHEVYTRHFKVLYPLAQQFPTWEQLSERERALLVATCKELATDEAETLLELVQTIQAYDVFAVDEVSLPIETRLKELGFLLCSTREGSRLIYYLSTPDPELWKEPTSNV